jgi:multiple sugar transport system permease protein
MAFAAPPPSRAPTPMSRHPVRMSRHARVEALTGFFCISPWLIGFLAFALWPLVQSIYLSFTDYDIFSPVKWVGLANWRKLLFVDDYTWHSLWVTAIYSVGAVSLSLVLGLALALLLNQQVNGISLYRTIFYAPAVVSGAAVAMMWLLIFNPEMGVVNSTLRLVGIQGPGWLFDKNWALPTFIIMSVWGVGGSMVLYLAALQGVPTELYEAAMIDGGGAFAKLWHITLPMISPVIFFNLIMGIIGSFQVFTSSYIMTQGGPERATYFFVLFIYHQAFENLFMGYASAAAWLLAIIILALTLLTFASSNRLVYYEGRAR